MSTRRIPLHRDERGMALAVAVFALVVIAVLVTATFYAATGSGRLSRGAMFGQQAFSAAEAGVDDVMATWDPATYNGQPVGVETPLPMKTTAAFSRYTPTVTRVNGNLFVVRAEGQRTNASGGVLARRLITVLARTQTAAIDIKGAVTVRGTLKVGGSSQISGSDNVPTGGGWGGVCAVGGTGVAGIRNSTNSINFNGTCSGGACVTTSGTNPKVLIDSTVTTGTFTQFGDVSYAELAAMANKVYYTPGVTPLPTFNVSNNVGPTYLLPIAPDTLIRCKKSDRENWGAPKAAPAVPPDPCFSYFPIIHVVGNLKMTGGAGQGILLIDGDLDMSGGAEFYGPVIVQGVATSTGTGGHIYGALLAQNADLSVTSILGNSVVDYSSCAVQRALAGSARGVPLGERSWVQLD